MGYDFTMMPGCSQPRTPGMLGLRESRGGGTDPPASTSTPEAELDTLVVADVKPKWAAFCGAGVPRLAAWPGDHCQGMPLSLEQERGSPQQIYTLDR